MARVVAVSVAQSGEVAVAAVECAFAEVALASDREARDQAARALLALASGAASRLGIARSGNDLLKTVLAGLAGVLVKRHLPIVARGLGLQSRNGPA